MSRFQTINMPTNPYDFPTQDSTTIARQQAENATITDVKFSTGKITFDATKLTEYYVLSSEIDEDSAPPILALARSEVSEAQFRAYETAIINGDDSGTHQDDDTDGGHRVERLIGEGGRQVFVHPKSTHGVLVQLTAKK